MDEPTNQADLDQQNDNPVDALLRQLCRHAADPRTRAWARALRRDHDTASETKQTRALTSAK